MLFYLTRFLTRNAHCCDFFNELITRCKACLERVQSLPCDSGYAGLPFARAVRDILGEHAGVQMARRSELHAFKVVPKRWIVEQGFAWLEKNRSVCGRTASGFQYQLAVRPSRISGSITGKIVNRLQALPR